MSGAAPPPMIVEARYAEDGRPEFDAADFKEMEVRARGPIDALTAAEMAMVLEAKEEGNSHFRSGNVETAVQAYNRALEVFADRTGDSSQRIEKSKLLANRAECLLRLQHWEAAAKSAALATSLDGSNAKARFRHARALVELGGEDHLRDAATAIEQLKASDGSLGRAERDLLRVIQTRQAELREVRRRDAEGLRAAFASGHAGLASEVSAAVGHADSGNAPSSSLAWMASFDSAALRHSWLIDVYRTRVDDDRQRDDGTPHGLADPNCSAASIVLDFLIFCRLAVARGVVPAAGSHEGATIVAGAAWDWAVLVGEQAPPMLGKAFCPEVCFPERRYGETMGSAERIRAAGELIYRGGGGGDEVEERQLGVSALEEAVRREAMDACWRDGGRDEQTGLARHMFTFDRSPGVFEAVGGVEAWRALLRTVV